MAALTIRSFMDPAYPVHENIWYSLPALYIILIFGVLFAMAIALRRNSPWHKRLITIATISLLQAAVDRVDGLPEQGPGYLHQAMYLDILLIPIVAFDWASLKRVHPATLAGGGLLVAAQSAVLLVWPSDWWTQSCVVFARALVRIF